MSLRSRFALAFAAVGAVVAVVVGALSYRAASDRVLAEIDRSLRTTTAALARAEEQDQESALSDAVTRAPDLFPGTFEPGPGDEEERQPILQAVSRDGTPTRLGGRPCRCRCPTPRVPWPPPARSARRTPRRSSWPVTPTVG
jgi:two-component system sensor histidine kinase MprB